MARYKYAPQKQSQRISSIAAEHKPMRASDLTIKPTPGLDGAHTVTHAVTGRFLGGGVLPIKDLVRDVLIAQNGRAWGEEHYPETKGAQERQVAREAAVLQAHATTYQSHRTTIVTRYHGPTDTRGARVSATARGRGGEPVKITIAWGDALNVSDNHAAACAAMRVRMGWVGEAYGSMVGGEMPDGTGYAFVLTGRDSGKV